MPRPPRRRRPQPRKGDAAGSRVRGHAGYITEAMPHKAPLHAAAKEDAVFILAAELLRAVAAPMRLKIISALCNGEKNVSELLEQVRTTQPNMSQHLNTLYKAGVLARRREGVSNYYSIANEQVVNICRSVCVQIAIAQEEN